MGYFPRKIREGLTGVSISLVCNGFKDIILQIFQNFVLEKNIFSQFVSTLATNKTYRVREGMFWATLLRQVVDIQYR